MERLTYWNCKEKGSALPITINDEGYTVCLEDVCAKLAAYKDAEEQGRLFDPVEYAKIAIMTQELKKYREAEEQGRLVVLPCRVGDTVYVIKPNSYALRSFPDILTISFAEWMRKDFGKTVFFTPEEAEAALREQL